MGVGLVAMRFFEGVWLSLCLELFLINGSARPKATIKKDLGKLKSGRKSQNGDQKSIITTLILKIVFIKVTKTSL